jgi:integrase
MPLTDVRVRNAKPAEKPYKLNDGHGLQLEVHPHGSKLWRLRFRLAGKENMFAIGSYPVVGLAEARTVRDAAKSLIRKGVNPAKQRKQERARQQVERANTFKAVGDEWLDDGRSHWTPRTWLQRFRILEREIYPVIGDVPVRQVDSSHVLAITRRVQRSAPAMAVLANQAIGAVCRLAMVTLRADTDPTVAIRGSLRPPPVEHHRPLSRGELPGFLERLEAYQGHYTTRAALHLMILTLARTNEVIGATWSEIDLGGGLWRIPAERMKSRQAHTVPLSTQALDLLKTLHAVTGNSEYLFPNRSDLHKPASPGMLWKAIVSMGYGGRFSPHGVRATGSTILNEQGFRSDVIEATLAHSERNATRAAYNRAEYLPERREMMQRWADYLDGLKNGADVVPLRFAGPG